MEFSLPLPILSCIIFINCILSTPVKSKDIEEFCDVHDCPKYATIFREKKRGFEMRCYYEESYWIETIVSSTETVAHARKRLTKYFQGENEEGEIMETPNTFYTVEVAKDGVEYSKEFNTKVSVLLPKDYLLESNEYPRPTSLNIKINKYDEFCAYGRKVEGEVTFGSVKLMSEFWRLTRLIKADGRSIIKGYPILKTTYVDGIPQAYGVAFIAACGNECPELLSSSSSIYFL